MSSVNPAWLAKEMERQGKQIEELKAQLAQVIDLLSKPAEGRKKNQC